MDEKTNNELLREFAKLTHRLIVDKESPYPKSGVGIPQKFRRVIYMPNNAQQTSFFIWFSDPYARIGISTVFCGAFIKIPSKIQSKINIRKKVGLDKLNIFSNSKTNKIGVDYFDSKAIINGDLGATEIKFFSHSRLQQYILEALDIEGILNVSINEFNIDFVSEFKHTSYLSVINPQTWILERKFIEDTFKQVEKIRTILR